jgi:general secretion pathway protein D
VPNKATIVLGGLITKNVSTSKSGIPYLMKLPLVGPLFRDTTKNTSRTELIILMRPVVSNTPTETVLNRENEQEHLMMEPDIEATLDPPSNKARVKSASEDLLVVPQPPLRSEK